MGILISIIFLRVGSNEQEDQVVSEQSANVRKLKNGLQHLQTFLSNRC